MTPAELPAAWRTRAELFGRHGAATAAACCRELAAELEGALVAAGDETLTLAEAARESGYSDRRLRELLADGSITNAGRKGAPRVRRADLPRKARPAETANGYNAQEDALRLLGRT
jgi:hypothetical protein